MKGWFEMGEEAIAPMKQSKGAVQLRTVALKGWFEGTEEGREGAIASIAVMKECRGRRLEGNAASVLWLRLALGVILSPNNSNHSTELAS